MAILYLGTDPTAFLEKTGPCRLVHYPVIAIVPRSLEQPEIYSVFQGLSRFTHILFMSKNGVEVFCAHLKALQMSLEEKRIIAIGSVTAKHLAKHQIIADDIALEERQEGVIKILRSLGKSLDSAQLLLLRSSISRPLISNYLKEKGIPHQICDLYDTVSCSQEPKPDLTEIDQIVFTSPSTVRAFLELFGELPEDKKLVAIGPITERFLKFCKKSHL